MKTRIQKLFIALLILTGIHQAAAQDTTAFTYQGQLHDNGTNANGTYAMFFKLYDANTNGTQVGSTIATSPTLANGLFTVNLDFGAGAFNGSARWLDITVSNGIAQTLSPRVEVLPTPYALYAAVAATVTNGGIMNAQLAINAVATTNIQNGAITTTQIATNAVATTNIQNGAITTALIATNAVNATNIASGQVVKSFNGLTDFITLTAGANTALFTNGNSLQLSAVVPNVTGFTSSGTFIVPTNVTRIKVEIWGGGGGGGNGSSSYPGGGGGAGGYIFNVFNVTPGTSYIVTVGSGGNAGQAGGNSSFGALMSAAGGHAGSAGGSDGSGAGGSGGTTSGGVGPLIGSAGDGGSTFTGAGGNGASAAGDLGGTGGWGDAGSPPGNNSNGPGAGGGGGAAGGGGGGSGDGGLVVVYY